MFEVTFTARQRKNYLFYCLHYLFSSKVLELKSYGDFLRNLADKYFKDVYLMKENLNEINVPKPGSFDTTVLVKKSESEWVIDEEVRNDKLDFTEVFGNGTERSKGIPLFVFNYLDYLLWEYYAKEQRGHEFVKDSIERNTFFETLGCSDFGLDIFKKFYFSRTRKSLEHYFAQANVKSIEETPSHEQINCFGNYAMIGSDANSSGSNWMPIYKRYQYLDTSRKIQMVSVASLKFLIMLQKCKDNEGKRVAGQEWNFEDIHEHQNKMVEMLLN
jgi:hypothetical protein